MASAGGAWIVAVKGFAGVYEDSDGIHCRPALPEKWKEMYFKLYYKGTLYGFRVTHSEIVIRKLHT